MAKKRKNSGRNGDDASGPNLDVGESRKRIRTYEDVADSDDEFYLNQDKVLLDEQPEVKRKRTLQEQEEFLQPSDEEILAHTDSEDEDVYDDALEDPEVEDGGAQSGSDDGFSADKTSDGEEEAWGTTKADLYGADEIETEEQALEEEAEAMRLQKKQIESLSAADYGFDETEWQGAGDANAEWSSSKEIVREVLPQLQIPEDMPDVERLKQLKSRYPEFEPLRQDLLDLHETQPRLKAEADVAKTYGLTRVPNAVTKQRASIAYMGAVTTYFALLTSTASVGDVKAVAMSATKLREHPVMDSLFSCRELWQRAQKLPVDPAPKTQVSDEGEESILLADGTTSRDKKRGPRKSRAQRHAEAVHAAAEQRKTERIQRTESSLADLDALIVPGTNGKRSKLQQGNVVNDDDSDLGEEAPLTARETAEKAQKKKSLRFYTSQIAQKVNKRGAAGRGAGGDDDVPHRERLRDRQARLNAEAEKRGHKQADIGDDLGGASDDDDQEQARQIRETVDEDDVYYDMVASRTSKKKFEKAAFAQAQKEAALVGGQVIEQEVVGDDSKRKISYLIEKNKGLTPHRKKDVRNPRVKKRKKYDEKKKKLASMKPVYKGGEGRGGYGGELTGIKKGLVKSTKL